MHDRYSHNIKIKVLNKKKSKEGQALLAQGQMETYFKSNRSLIASGWKR
jgi:hypothetical protein